MKKTEVKEEKSKSITIPSSDTDQHYALKRIRTIAEGHLKDKFKSPELCQAITEIHQLSVKLLEKYYASLS